MSTHETATDSGTRWGRLWGIVSGAAIALALLAMAFVWPAAESEMDGFTVAVTGQSAAVTAFTEAAEDGLADVVEIVTVDDRDAAIQGIEEREYIGALVLGEDPEVLIASAAGQVPAAFMNQMAGQLQGTIDGQIYLGVTEGLRSALSNMGAPGGQGGQPGQTPEGPPEGAPGEAPEGAAPGGAAPSGPPGGNPAQMMLENIPESLPTVEVTDVVPYSEGDENGTGIASAGIPLTVGSLLAGILIAFTVSGRWARTTAVLGLGIGGGLILTLILGTWLEAYPGPFGLVWLALSLSVAATSALFVGLHGLIGRAGLGLAAILTLFAAMPWAAFAVPYQFLPGGLGSVGQGLIPGATTTLSRNISYFPDAASGSLWWTLWIWVILGLVLLVSARQKAPHSPSSAPQPHES